MIEKDNTRQVWDSKSYQRDAGFVSKLGEGVLDWLAPQAGERILDLGCGDGALSIKIKQAGAVVVGADASDSFVTSAIELGIDAHVMDAHNLTFKNEFDAVFSNAALHWMLEPEKVIKGVHKSLKPTGRFVGEFGGFGNIAAVTTAMHGLAREMQGDAALAGPWFYPTVDEYSEMLEANGFSVEEIITFYRPTPLPQGIKAWLKVIRGPFFEQFNENEDEAYQRVMDALEPSLKNKKGNWFADYVRLRFRAHRK